MVTRWWREGALYTHTRRNPRYTSKKGSLDLPMKVVSKVCVSGKSPQLEAARVLVFKIKYPFQF